MTTALGVPSFNNASPIGSILAFENALHQTTFLHEGRAKELTYICEFALGRLESRRGHYGTAVDYLTCSFEGRQALGHEHGMDFVFEELVRAASRLSPIEAVRILDWCIECIKDYPESDMKFVAETSQSLKKNLMQNIIYTE